MHVEKEISRDTVYAGRLVNVRHDVAEIADGQHVGRVVVEHPGGVCIIPVDADNNCWCVRQFRYPFMEELLEFPAGKLELGEDPFECAIRELAEETGLSAGQVIYLGPIYPSPGYLNEILHLYLALDLSLGEASPDEGEFLTVEQIPMDTLLEMAAAGNIPDAKTALGIFRAAAYLKQ